MKLPIVVVAIVLASLAAGARGDVDWPISAQGPAPGLPGYTAHILRLNAGAEQKVIAISLTFAGPMHQAEMLDLVTGLPGPVIMSTATFQATGADEALRSDSHFLFNPQSGHLSLSDGVSETDGTMFAGFLFIGGYANPIATRAPDVAQIVLADGQTASFDGYVILSDPHVSVVRHELSGVVPEPATLALLACGGLAALRRRREP